MQAIRVQGVEPNGTSGTFAQILSIRLIDVDRELTTVHLSRISLIQTASTRHARGTLDNIDCKVNLEGDRIPFIPAWVSGMLTFC